MPRFALGGIYRLRSSDRCRRARLDIGGLDADGFDGLFAFDGRAVDLFDRFHAAHDAPERRKLAVEVRRIAGEDEEVRRGAVGFFRARHRNNAANVFDRARLVGDGAPGALHKFQRQPLARRDVAALNDKVFDDAAKVGRVEKVCGGEVEKIPHRFGRGFRQHLDFDDARFGIKRHALSGHFGDRRAVEWFGDGSDGCRWAGIGFLDRRGLTDARRGVFPLRQRLTGKSSETHDASRKTKNHRHLQALPVG